jgi:hypothetical protein
MPIHANVDLGTGSDASKSSAENRVDMPLGCALLVAVLLWVTTIVVLTLTGTWRLSWGEWLGATLGGAIVLWILYCPGAHAAIQTAKEFPDFARARELTPNSTSARDEAAIQLAILFDWGCSSPFLFCWHLEWLYISAGILLAFVGEILSWAAASAGVFAAGSSPAVAVANMLCGRDLIKRLRRIYHAGIFSRKDIHRAYRGIVPSDNVGLWCVCGVDSPVYCIRNQGGTISLRVLGSGDEWSLPMERLRGVDFFDLDEPAADGENAPVRGSKNREIRWLIPEISRNRDCFVLQASMNDHAVRILWAWRNGQQVAPPLECAVKRSKLAVVAVLAPLFSFLLPLGAMVCNTLRSHAPATPYIPLLILSPLILGIPCGHLASARCRYNPLLLGRGAARIGLWTCYGLCLLVCLVYAFL